MSNDFKFPPRAPNKSGYVPGANLKNRADRKGKPMPAANIGPWVQLVAMWRVQNGEPARRVCVEIGISTETMARWQKKFGGDVAHVRPVLNADGVEEALGVLVRLKRLMATEMAHLQRIVDAATGEVGHYVAKRDLAKKIKPSKLPRDWNEFFPDRR